MPCRILLCHLLNVATTLQFLVNIDPSLEPTTSNKLSKSAKPFKVKVSVPSGKSLASPRKPEDPCSSPYLADHAGRPASTPPGSPHLNGTQTPSSNASSPDRSPGSILRVRISQCAFLSQSHRRTETDIAFPCQALVKHIEQALPAMAGEVSALVAVLHLLSCQDTGAGGTLACLFS
jgi:hypothetical protein